MLHEEEHSLAVLVLPGVDVVLVCRKISVVREGGVIAQLAHQRTSDDRLHGEGSQRISMDLIARHIAGRCSRRGGRLKDQVFVLLHDILLFPAKLGHVLLVAGHTLHHAARTDPTPGHEHVLLEAILNNVGEWIPWIRRYGEFC